MVKLTTTNDDYDDDYYDDYYDDDCDDDYDDDYCNDYYDVGCDDDDDDYVDEGPWQSRMGWLYGGAEREIGLQLQRESRLDEWGRHCLSLVTRLFVEIKDGARARNDEQMNL